MGVVMLMSKKEAAVETTFPPLERQFRPRQQVMPLSDADVEALLWCLVGSRGGCVLVEREAGAVDGWIEVVPIRPAHPMYAIWKPTGAVYELASDGTVSGSPLWESRVVSGAVKIDESR